MLFSDLRLPDRARAAVAVGFRGVEIQFPSENDIIELRRARIPVTLINVRAGPAQPAGLASLPGHEAAHRAAVVSCAAQAKALGARKVNVLAGCPPKDACREECFGTLTQNLRFTADVMAQIGVRVMVEPVNTIDVPGFFLSGLDMGLEALARADHPNLALQFDLYHMAITEPDLPDAIRRAGAQIGHVQFADTPGRHEPGSGTIDFASAFAALRETGYDDVVSAEYRPLSVTTENLAWMVEFAQF